MQARSGKTDHHSDQPLCIFGPVRDIFRMLARHKFMLHRLAVMLDPVKEELERVKRAISLLLVKISPFHLLGLG